VTGHEGPQDVPPAAAELAVVPAMPVVPKVDLYSAPHLLADHGIRHSLGWQDHRKAGPSFVVASLNPLGGVKVTDRFPLTEEGWADAWRTLADLDPAAAAVVAKRLAALAALQDAAVALDALAEESMRTLPHVRFSGGSGATRLISGQDYDVRFLSDRVSVCPSRSATAAAEIAYPDVEAVEASTTNSGRPTSEFIILIAVCGVVLAMLGLFVLGLVGLIFGAVTGGMIGAAIGSASGTAETTIRIKGGGNEYYFVLSGKRAEAVKIALSEPLRVIEIARPASAPAPTFPAPASSWPTPPEPAEVTSESVPDQLTKLASLLQQDLITRAEFEQLKADVIAGS
jgi:hypothetical protein